MNERYGIKLYAAPASEPVSLDEMKLSLKQDEDDDDALITAQIIAAREHIEIQTNRQLVTATFDLWLDSFPDIGNDRNEFVFINDKVQYIKLPKPALQSVTYIKYYDEANVLQTLDAANYQVDSISEPGRVVPVAGLNWPITYNRINSVNIRFVCGYGAAANVPEGIKAVLKLLVGDMYNLREETIVGTIATPAKLIERLLRGYVVPEM